ncbi:hypothetical protein [Paenibacillus massiliensis]|uniref:hypothetical protein n=1 Tax=Paenibacillus massiliensis TaxID=225917 RepID=UPI000490411E|nr:hypothetical protein [Paenibacillus massiliensis]
MIKKISSILFSIALFLSLSSSVFAQSETETVSPPNNLILQPSEDFSSIKLEVGQKVTIPLKLVEQSSDGITPNKVYQGDGGTLTLEPTATGVDYSIVLYVPATSFVGFMNMTDLKSGLSLGSTPVTGFSGTVPYSPMKGHYYSASLTGTAYLAGIPVAKTVWNYMTWYINP